MNVTTRSSLTLAALTAGLALPALSVSAQLLIDLSSQATFGAFVGGVNNNVSNNGAWDTEEVITTGLPSAAPFSITYVPLVGPILVNLGTGTLNTSTFLFNSTLTPLEYFTSVPVALNYDFDNDGGIDLAQNYTLSLAPYDTTNGFTGVTYMFVPQQTQGTVSIDGLSYDYASVVSNNGGILFDGSSTTTAIQFQFTLAADAPGVPEPSTYALLGVLLLSAIIAARRMR